MATLCLPSRVGAILKIWGGVYPFLEETIIYWLVFENFLPMFFQRFRNFLWGGCQVVFFRVNRSDTVSCTWNQSRQFGDELLFSSQEWLRALVVATMDELQEVICKLAPCELRSMVLELGEVSVDSSIGVPRWN